MATRAGVVLAGGRRVAAGDAATGEQKWRLSRVAGWPGGRVAPPLRTGLVTDFVTCWGRCPWR
ncbi:hypothetical protein [Streptomyces albogriseolus]|uniref:hypothetical protein n=1 Tax=Streptomyces albogriseolus TaxID=1887 RepID=UPI0034615FB1